MKIRQTILAVTGTAALIAALYFLLVSAEGGEAAAGCAGLVGWGVPVLAGAVIGGVLWVLSGQQSRSVDDGPSVHAAGPCPSCGEPVMGEWRLCPSCGSRLEDLLAASEE